LIIGACFVSIAIAALGMDSMWGSVEWIINFNAPMHRESFWYTNGLAIAMAIALCAAWLPTFPVSRLLRVAVLMPILHLVAIVVAGIAWSVLRHEVELAGWGSSHLPKIALPSAAALVVASAAVLAIGIAIKRRHGEWAHATVMLTLSFLLLVGLWLPILARLSVSAPGPFRAAEALQEYGDELGWYWNWRSSHRLLSREVFTLLAIVPTALIAVGFTALRFRSPRAFARIKGWPSTTVKLLLGGAILAALTSPDEGWLLYLESSYLVLFAALLAIGALITLTVTTRLGSLAAHFWFRRLPKLEGVIAHDDDGEAARFEITSWLRGPRLATRSFVVTTPHGSVPLDGVHVLAPIPATTTNLDVGEHAPVLQPGDRVVIAGRATKGADPFRSIGGTDIAVIAARGSRPYRFSDATLVVWRPAVAYLAILIAVALPYLSIVLT
jgi:hypothetical protein